MSWMYPKVPYGMIDRDRTGPGLNRRGDTQELGLIRPQIDEALWKGEDLMIVLNQHSDKYLRDAARWDQMALIHEVIWAYGAIANDLEKVKDVPMLLWNDYHVMAGVLMTALKTLEDGIDRLVHPPSRLPRPCALKIGEAKHLQNAWSTFKWIKREIDALDPEWESCRLILVEELDMLLVRNPRTTYTGLM